MPGLIDTELGQIILSEDVIATVAGYAAGDNFGIVGMSGKTAKDALIQFVGGTNHKRGVNGTGIGLSIVKNILIMHGAEYGIKSELGKGSDFWFKL